MTKLTQIFLIIFNPINFLNIYYNNVYMNEIPDESISSKGSNITPSPEKGNECTVEVKRKPMIESFHEYFFIILGSVLILVGIIDMIVFYVVPYNEIKKNKEKFSDLYEFEKLDSVIVSIHFVLHVFLIGIGIFFIVSVLKDIIGTSFFYEILFIVLIVFGVLYILEVVFSGVDIHMFTKEDYTLTKIEELLNSQTPINSILLYMKGTIKSAKGKHYTCYSKNGLSFNVKSNLFPPLFNTTEKTPDFFYLKVSQNVKMSEQILSWIEKGKNKIISCQKKHGADYHYYPKVEGKLLILSDGKKIPSKMKKPNVITSLVFGLGIYPELLIKSIPVKKFEQNSFADVLDDVDYNALIEAVDCSFIGECKTSNKKPHI